MKKLIGLTITLLMLTGCSRCSGCVRTSGHVSTLTRKVGVFTAVSIEGPIDTDMTIGPASEIELTADDKMLSLIQTEIRGDTLHLSIKEGSYSTYHSIKTKFHVPALYAVSLAGSGDVNLRNYQGPALTLSIMGSGDMEVDGETDSLTASIAGAGDMELYGLKAKKAKINVMGSGDVETTVTESLTASISGAGDIDYKGHPRVEMSITGSGDISAKD